MGDEEKRQQLLAEKKQLLDEKQQLLEEKKQLSLDEESKKLLLDEEKQVLEDKIKLIDEENQQLIDKEKNLQLLEEKDQILAEKQRIDKDKAITRKKSIWLASGVFSIIIIGLILAFWLNNFAIVPFTVVLTGIVAFWGTIIISNQLADRDDQNSGEMRRAITVAIVVVYLGLLPTLAFSGILQYQVLDLKPSANLTLNETLQTIPQPIEESTTAITSFTALVTAVILFYFGMRTWEEVKKLEATNTSEENKK
ncbi:MAG: hypothetical protein Q8N08_08710 [Methanobacteriaceae archaeon]|nr:hypothetical protein [Methanobacteriaceae archaeon]